MDNSEIIFKTWFVVHITHNIIILIKKSVLQYSLEMPQWKHLLYIT